MSSSEEPAPQKMIVLKSSDGQLFEVEQAVAVQSETIKKHMIEDDGANNVILLRNIASKILAMVIEYCKRHVEAINTTPPDDDGLKAFDAEFMKVDKGTLFGLVCAAHILNIKNLFDLTCQTIADRINELSQEEIKKIFHLKPEQKAELHRKYLC